MITLPGDSANQQVAALSRAPRRPQ